MSPAPYDGHHFPTPPSTAGFSSHMPHVPSTDVNTVPPSPLQNTPISTTRDAMDHGDTPMADAPDYRRSDHDRQAPSASASAPYPMPLLCRTRKIPFSVTAYRDYVLLR